MNILIGCEYSGVVREAFKKRGFNAWSCDILETDIPGNHLKGDVLGFLDMGWDAAIFFPPCTYLTNSGVRWLYNSDGTKNVDRWRNLDKGALFFKTLLEADIPSIAIENPVPHKHAIERIGRKYDKTVQPYDFGHTTSKRTCFWLKGFPPLQKTHSLKKEQRTYEIHKAPPGPNRWKIRSKTFQGIADAMAKQWGDYLLNKGIQLQLFNT